MKKRDEVLIYDRETGELPGLDIEVMISRAKDTGLAQLDKNGHEILSPVQVAPPVDFREGVDLFDHLKRLDAMRRRHEQLVEGDETEDVDDLDPSLPPDDIVSEFEDRYTHLRELAQKVLDADTSSVAPSGAPDASASEGADGSAGKSPVVPPVDPQKPAG